MENTQENQAVIFDPIGKIDQAIDDLGISVVDLCEAAGVNHVSLYRWFKEEPKTIKMLRSLFETIDGLKQEQLSNEK